MQGLLETHSQRHPHQSRVLHLQLLTEKNRHMSTTKKLELAYVWLCNLINANKKAERWFFPLSNRWMATEYKNTSAFC